MAKLTIMLEVTECHGDKLPAHEVANAVLDYYHKTICEFEFLRAEWLDG